MFSRFGLLAGGVQDGLAGLGLVLDMDGKRALIMGIVKIVYDLWLVGCPRLLVRKARLLKLRLLINHHRSKIVNLLNEDVP